MEVDWKEASRFGLMVADEDDKITEFQEKPPVPKSNLASMGIYIFNWDVLKKYLEAVSYTHLEWMPFFPGICHVC